MFRKFIALALFVSFIAMSTSGLMMFVIERPSFTIQMHPVHKIFGLVMIFAVLGHLGLNYRSILAYLKTQSVAIFAGVLFSLLTVLYGIALMNKIPEEIAGPMDKLAEQVE
ncbi:MAG: DUF4405 domain-containing protein [Halieaceae bacterium]|nr:DUF4405 domain-containing protein [Halieaceae bacterium]